MKEQPRPLYCRVNKAPVVFGMSTSTVYRLAQRGVLKIYKRGSSSYLKCAEVAAYIEGTA
ncbi:hypothetical protein GCM10016455_05830 [Aliiroseovarius zhejiangensis]|uniref:Helix-turn-helix domain-containing protein n=1 Tax=Aliiroseovarius zhejiangensis TaxID=1632025 RepID=A0ABQ3IMZ9_9RHOB|nr:helix-turn-helix domain-containing protein [Aliiroseovarius zhejiangensis]GHE88535.1 hypothetical protein GCM10016455_05830 [Aliiroseovarius zhejiangensis]